MESGLIMVSDLIDIGANIAHDSFDEDRADMMQRAAVAGVSRIIVTGSSDASNVRAASLAEQSPGVLYSTAGVHPHHASDYTDNSDALIRSLIQKDVVVAVGECGLDYFRDFSPREAQLAAFRRQLDIAKESGLPVFLHQRDAHDDFVEILEPALPDLSRAVAHCFTGEGESLREYVAMGLYIGITGWICDERRGKHLHDIVSIIPDDRILIETDAPYLLPRTVRPRPKSRRNEPMYLPEVARVVAEARGQSEEHIGKITTANAERFFGLDQISPVA
jgi:TatD DNase family protein